MRTALIVIGLAVVLAIIGTVFRESLFPGAEPTAQKPASAPPTTAAPKPSVPSLSVNSWISTPSEPNTRA